MAEIVNLTGSSHYGFGREVRYLDGVNAETVTADATITAYTGNVLFVSGGTCNLDLPAEADSEGKWHIIKNTGTGVYTVRDDGGTTIATLGGGEWCYVACDGTAWRSAMDSTLTAAVDQDVALTGTGSGYDLDVTINHATQVGGGFDSDIAQLTTARTSGYAYAYRAKTTSLAGDLNGVPYSGLYVLAPTDGGGAVLHSGLYVEAGNDYSVHGLDNVRTAWGTGAAGVADATMGWDATILSLLPAVDDSVYKIGNGTLSFDVWIYGDTASDYVEWDASVSTLFLRGAAALTVVGSSILGPVSSPMTAAQDISGNGQTITLPTTGINKAISSGAARTGTILAAGTVAGQLVVIHNTNASGGDAITFDATPATSRVAQGTHAISAGTARLYTWDATAALWFPVG